MLDLDRQFTLRAWCFELFLCLAFQIGFVWKWKFPSGFSRFHHHRASERHQPSAAVGEARPVSSTLDQRPAAQSYAYWKGWVWKQGKWSHNDLQSCYIYVLVFTIYCTCNIYIIIYILHTHHIKLWSCCFNTDLVTPVSGFQSSCL